MRGMNLIARIQHTLTEAHDMATEEERAFIAKTDKMPASLLLKHRGHDHKAINKLARLDSVRDWMMLDSEDRHHVHQFANAVINTWQQGGDKAGLGKAATHYRSLSKAGQAYLLKHAVPDHDAFNIYAGRRHYDFDKLGDEKAGRSLGKGHIHNYTTDERVAHVFAHRAAKSFEGAKGTVIASRISRDKVIAHVNTLEKNIHLPLTMLGNHASIEKSSNRVWDRYSADAYDAANRMADIDKKMPPIPHQFTGIKPSYVSHTIDDTAPHEYNWENEILSHHSFGYVHAIHSGGMVHMHDGSKRPYTEEEHIGQANEARLPVHKLAHVKPAYVDMAKVRADKFDHEIQQPISD